MEVTTSPPYSSAAHIHEQCLAVKDVLVHTTLTILNVLPSERVIAQKQGYRSGEMIGEELGHKLAVEISQDLWECHFSL